jgi:hypothetical protein
MNEYRALVEWQWQGKTEELGEKNPIQSHFDHHISHVQCPGVEHRPPLWKAEDQALSHNMAPTDRLRAVTPRPRHSFSRMETNELLIRDFTLPTRCSSKSSIFWVVTQRWLVAVYRSCKKVYQSLLTLDLWRCNFVGPRRLIHRDE